MSGLRKAIQVIGSQAALSRILGVKPMVVNQWLKPERRVPVEYLASISEATNGEVTPVDLRPDLADVLASGPPPDQAA